MHFFIKNYPTSFLIFKRNPYFCIAIQKKPRRGVMNDMNASVYKLIIKPLNLKQND